MINLINIFSFPLFLPFYLTFIYLFMQQQQHVQRANYNQRTPMQNQLVGRQQYQYSNNALNLATMNSQQVQQPPPLVRSGTQQQAQM